MITFSPVWNMPSNLSKYLFNKFQTPKRGAQIHCSSLFTFTGSLSWTLVLYGKVDSYAYFFQKITNVLQLQQISDIM